MRILQRCASCPVRERSLFCNLSPEALQELSTIRRNRVYPSGTVLFGEEEPAHGLFVLCFGRVKLIASSLQGRSLFPRVAGPGEVLGLNAVISNTAYGTSGETLGSAEVSFIPRLQFRDFLAKYGEVSLPVAEYLSMELRRAYRQLTRIERARSARAKLAALLLEWGCPEGEPDSNRVRFQLSLTQEEIGELIGSSRETVCRILNEFRRKGLIEISDGSLVTLFRPKDFEAMFG